jgi:CubicO group peptidase (beta-lactamase class C family)
MHRKKYFIAFFITIFFVNSVSAQLDNVETYIQNEMQKRKIPGLQIAIVHHGKIVLLKSFGTANIENSVLVSNQTVFPLHSITKAFVGVAVMQLVEDKKLELAAPISRYLDNLPVAWQAITVQQLMTHTSGIPDLWDNTPKMIAESEDKVWAKLYTMPMEFVPGEQFKYVQTNYALIGKIINKLSGKPFTQFIKERQFDVVGMPNSSFGDSHDVVPHISGNYWYFRNVNGMTQRTNTLENYFLDWPAFIWTAVGINTSAEDLVRWSVAVQQGKLFKEKSTLKTLWTPGILNNGKTEPFNKLLNGYAIGTPIAIRTEHRAVGSTGGGRAAIFIYPDDDLTVAILTNLIGASPEFFIDEVAGYYVPSMKASSGFGLPPAIQTLRTQLLKRGFERAFEVFNEEKKKDSKDELSESDINNWGYALLQQGKKREAIEIFKLNVILHPESSNAYDSLGEAYMNNGDNVKAVENYEKSLKLDPKNTNAVEMLKKLKGEK